MRRGVVVTKHCSPALFALLMAVSSLVTTPATTVKGVVDCKFTKWKVVCKSQPTPLRTQREGYNPDTMSPADAVGVERQMLRFGSTYFVDPTYRDTPNAAQMF